MYRRRVNTVAATRAGTAVRSERGPEHSQGGFRVSPGTPPPSPRLPLDDGADSGEVRARENRRQQNTFVFGKLTVPRWRARFPSVSFVRRLISRKRFLLNGSPNESRSRAVRLRRRRPFPFYICIYVYVLTIFITVVVLTKL